MKKITISFGLLVSFVFFACDMSKNAAATTPAQTISQKPSTPIRSDMKESDMKITPSPTYEKKLLPVKSKMRPMEAVSTPDTITPKF